MMGFTTFRRQFLWLWKNGHSSKKCSVVSIPVPQRRLSSGVSIKFWRFLWDLNGVGRECQKTNRETEQSSETSSRRPRLQPQKRPVQSENRKLRQRSDHCQGIQPPAYQTDYRSPRLRLRWPSGKACDRQSLDRGSNPRRSRKFSERQKVMIEKSARAIRSWSINIKYLKMPTW